MAKAWFDQAEMKERLISFFEEQKPNVAVFGNTVNQTFEAFVLAALIAWYRQHGWKVRFVHPRKQTISQSSRLVLKYSTRGKPAHYSYVVCTKGEMTVQVHHQLRVATRHHRRKNQYPANICLDVAVIGATDVSTLSSDDAVSNSRLITFGEAKHMTAFAELIAGFVGVVHEMQPARLRQRAAALSNRDHLCPFLYVSGDLNRSAKGLIETIHYRQLRLEIYNSTHDVTAAFKLRDDAFRTSMTQIKRRRKNREEERFDLSENIPY